VGRESTMGYAIMWLRDRPPRIGNGKRSHPFGVAGERLRITDQASAPGIDPLSKENVVVNVKNLCRRMRHARHRFVVIKS